MYVRLFTNPLSQIAQAMTSMQSTAAASERVFGLLEEVEMDSENDITKKLDKHKVKVILNLRMLSLVMIRIILLLMILLLRLRLEKRLLLLVLLELVKRRWLIYL